MTIRRALVSPKLPEFRSGNDEIDRKVSQYLNEHVANVYERIKSLTPERGEFAPIWDGGFSADPVGNIDYMDSGDTVIMWSDGMLGTSNDVFMAWAADSIPASLRPSAARYVTCQVADGVLADVFTGGVIINSDGSAEFGISESFGGGPRDALVTNDFGTAAFSQKGLPSGWIIQYAK